MDASTLAKPVTRTLLIVGGQYSNFPTIWSRHVEGEADRIMGANKAPVAMLRERFGWKISSRGDAAQRFAGTDAKDRQVLADAVAAESHYLVTEDVDDFGVADLMTAGIAAVNPDLFLSVCLTEAGYQTALLRMSLGRQQKPRTPSALHAAIAKQHPRLFARFADLYDVEPLDSLHKPPKELFRGPRCVRCGELVADTAELVEGLHDRCRHAAS